MKQFAKSFVVSVLGWQVRRLRAKHEFKVVAVAGSIGKTSTKLAIAGVLSQSMRIRYQDGNYNDISSVPLIFFGLPMPGLLNPLAWLISFIKIEGQLRRPYPYDAVVVEVGTDGPGQIARFGSYLHADIGVLTSISLEHMEFFSNLDEVAAEELALGQLCDKLIVNTDLCPDHYLDTMQAPIVSYGQQKNNHYSITSMSFSATKSHFVLRRLDEPWLQASFDALGKGEVYSAVAAAVVADTLGMNHSDVMQGIAKLKAAPGRMQRLKGINGSTIIDETYNASPEAVKAALDTLYDTPAPYKIAVLGNMNELGKYAKSAHQDIGAYCDPSKLGLVMTIGPDANNYLATSAQSMGCSVQRFNSPYELGATLEKELKAGTLILLKGSQNKVFLEESIKFILANSSDERNLVRQSPQWQKKKLRSFAQS